MKTIGLTGGIASGKTAVANTFAQYGVHIVDSDVIARELVLPGTSAWAEIRNHFGDTILQADQSLDRQTLRKLIFDMPEERLWLEKLLHPAIRHEMKKQLEAASSPYSIAVIPLLVENLPHPLVDRILVVDTPELLQLKRLMERDQHTEAQAQAIINAQINREKRLAAADDIIENSGDLITLEKHVQQLHEKYLKWTQKS